MICKNCGLENPDGAKFCAQCGQKIDMGNVPQNNVPQNNIPQNNIPQNNIPQNNIPQNNIPQNNIPQNNVPQNNVPQNNIPQNNIPQNNIPQNNVPQNNIPQNNYQPQNYMPQNNIPSQTVIDPVTGQPVANGGKKFDFKKHLPLFAGIAGGVVAIVVVIVIVVSIVSSVGVKGVLNNLEDGINNKDVKALQKCVPEFLATDLDVDDFDSLLGSVGDSYDFEVDFEVKSEEDVTDADCDDNDLYTWKEYIQDEYESEEKYDGGEVQAVKKANVKMEMDFDNDLANSLAGLASSYMDDELTEEIIFVKYDGDWYLYDM